MLETEMYEDAPISFQLPKKFEQLIATFRRIIPGLNIDWALLSDGYYFIFRSQSGRSLDREIICKILSHFIAPFCHFFLDDNLTISCVYENDQKAEIRFFDAMEERGKWFNNISIERFSTAQGPPELSESEIKIILDKKEEDEKIKLKLFYYRLKHEFYQGLKDTKITELKYEHKSFAQENFKQRLNDEVINKIIEKLIAYQAIIINIKPQWVENLELKLTELNSNNNYYNKEILRGCFVTKTLYMKKPHHIMTEINKSNWFFFLTDLQTKYTNYDINTKDEYNYRNLKDYRKLNYNTELKAEYYNLMHMINYLIAPHEGFEDSKTKVIFNSIVEVEVVEEEFGFLCQFHFLKKKISTIPSFINRLFYNPESVEEYIKRLNEFHNNKEIRATFIQEPLYKNINVLGINISLPKNQLTYAFKYLVLFFKIHLSLPKFEVKCSCVWINPYSIELTNDKYSTLEEVFKGFNNEIKNIFCCRCKFLYLVSYFKDYKKAFPVSSDESSNNFAINEEISIERGGSSTRMPEPECNKDDKKTVPISPDESSNNFAITINRGEVLIERGESSRSVSECKVENVATQCKKKIGEKTIVDSSHSVSCLSPSGYKSTNNIITPNGKAINIDEHQKNVKMSTSNTVNSKERSRFNKSIDFLNKHWCFFVGVILIVFVIGLDLVYFMCVSPYINLEVKDKWDTVIISLSLILIALLIYFLCCLPNDKIENKEQSFESHNLSEPNYAVGLLEGERETSKAFSALKTLPQLHL